MPATLEAIKDLLDEQGKTFKNFKDENDKRLKEIEKNGTANATTVGNVEKLNKRLEEITNELETARKANEALEAAVNRMNLSGGIGSPNDPAAKFANDLDTFNALTGAKLAADGYRNYDKAFNGYLRFGPDKIGGELRNALSVGSDADAGYFVTPDKSGRIVEKVYQTSPIRQIANVITIGTDALEGAIDNGQPTSGWVAEKGTRSETNTPQVGVWRIPVHEQYAEPKATQKLLDDSSFDVEGWLGRKVSSVLSRTENTAFVSGDGAGKPRGYLSYTAVATADATRAWGQLQYVPSGASGDFDATIKGDCLITLMYALKAEYWQGANFVMNSAAVGAVRKLKDGNGNYLWVPGSAAEPATLHGKPVVRAEDMPALAANSLSIAFGNFMEGYQIVDRQGIRVLRDPFTSKGFVKFYTTKRVGGDVVNFEAIKLLKFAAS